MKLPASPPDPDQMWRDLVAAPDRLAKIVAQTAMAPTAVEGYEHWDQLRHKLPPGGLSLEEYWFGLRLRRQQLLKQLPLQDGRGKAFFVGTPDPVLEQISRIDRDASGRIEISEVVTSPATRDRYIVSSLIEEAITSSQLEGAATTRKEAKKMIRSGRKPRNKDERMIANNYEAIEQIREWRDENITPERILALHQIVTADTLEDASEEGRLRRDDEDIFVGDGFGTVLHRPPAASELPSRLKAMCVFANGGSPGYYLHGVSRAILLHFWLAYDHPFVDGNGRTARALFYWSMLSQGYWITEFLSISRVIKRAPSRYARAFLYAETDGNDATYFVLDQLRTLRLAIRDLHQYLAKKMEQTRRAENLLRDTTALNHRQIALLSHALQHPDADYTFQSHGSSHRVVYQTARTDLLDLANRELLNQRKVRRQLHFSPRRDLVRRLKRLR